MLKAAGCLPWFLSIVLIAALAISCFRTADDGDSWRSRGGRDTRSITRGQVRLLNEGTSAVLEQLTSERGEFLFDFVPVGTYTLKYGNGGIQEPRRAGTFRWAPRKDIASPPTRCRSGGLTDEVTVDCGSGSGQYRVRRAAPWRCNALQVTLPSDDQFAM